jgi:Ras-related protein Rab-1A
MPWPYLRQKDKALLLQKQKQKQMEASEKRKIVVVGSAGVGKSALILSYVEEGYPSEYLATIGVDFRFKHVRIRDRLVKLQIWDTAGQERYRAITTSYYRGADLVVLVYDITRRETFTDLADWVTAVRQREPDARFLVVGNKADLWHERTVSQEEAGEFSARVGSGGYLEVSAKMGLRVSDVFERFATNSSVAPTPSAHSNIPTVILSSPQRRRFFSGLC